MTITITITIISSITITINYYCIGLSLSDCCWTTLRGLSNDCTFIAHQPKQCLRQVLTQIVWSMHFGAVAKPPLNKPPLAELCGYRKDQTEIYPAVRPVSKCSSLKYYSRPWGFESLHACISWDKCWECMFTHFPACRYFTWRYFCYAQEFGIITHVNTNIWKHGHLHAHFLHGCISFYAQEFGYGFNAATKAPALGRADGRMCELVCTYVYTHTCTH